jgi:hypothetical protein
MIRTHPKKRDHNSKNIPMMNTQYTVHVRFALPNLALLGRVGHAMVTRHQING